jgi:hypothetical protein
MIGAIAIHDGVGAPRLAPFGDACRRSSAAKVQIRPKRHEQS